MHASYREPSHYGFFVFYLFLSRSQTFQPIGYHAQLPKLSLNLNVKELSMLFFLESKRDGDRWKCENRGAYIFQRMSGFTNLCHHTNYRHAGTIQDCLRQKRKRSGGSFKTPSYPSKTVAVHAWLECIIICLHPFSFVESSIFRRHFYHNSISIDSLMCNMRNLTVRVEDEIKNLPLKKVGVVFDGWTGGNAHHVSVFSTFPSCHPCGYDSTLLALALLEMRTRLMQPSITII